MHGAKKVIEITAKEDYCLEQICFLPKQKPSIFSLDLHDKKTDTWIYSLKSCKNIPSVSSAGWGFKHLGKIKLKKPQ